MMKQICEVNLTDENDYTQGHTLHLYLHVHLRYMHINNSVQNIEWKQFDAFRNELHVLD